MSMLNKQKGFTLVETALIVGLVALLITGVLKGQEWYTNVKIYKLQSEFENIEALLYQYFIKVGRYPAQNANVSSQEQWEEAFWQDLRAANLLEGDPTDGSSPEHAFGEPNNVWFPSQGNFGSSIFRQAFYICATHIKDVYAKAIDLKIDDGNGKTGVIKSFKYSGYVNASGVHNYNKLGSVIDYPNNGTYMTVCKQLLRENDY